MPTINKIQIKKHQTLVDLAIQYCGTVEALAELAALNVLETTDELTPGALLLVPAAYDDRVAKYFSDNNLQPVTVVDETLGNEEGIEFWAIEYDFVVGPPSGARSAIHWLDDIPQGTAFKKVTAVEYEAIHALIVSYEGDYYTPLYEPVSLLINSLDDVAQGQAFKFLSAYECAALHRIIETEIGPYTVTYGVLRLPINSLDDVPPGALNTYLSAQEYAAVQQLISVYET